jgi:hypothetical protein
MTTGASIDSFAFSNTFLSSMLDLTSYPFAPKLSASFTKSGLLNLVNALLSKSF